MAAMESAAKKPAPDKIVFLSRVDTFVGKILTQHLSQITLDDTNQRVPPLEKGKMLDMDFMESTSREGSLKVFGTWQPEDPTDPYHPVKKHPRLPAIQGMCPADSYTDIAKMITAADICVFNLLDDDSVNGVLESTAKALTIAQGIGKKSQNPKTLVLVSSVMTWAKTKNLSKSKENLESVLAEEEFRRRKPHPHYRGHFELEKSFLELGYHHQHLTITIVAAGVVYGMGENLLHPLFRDAWKGNTVKVIGDGKNVLPCIHVRDLCQIVEYSCLNVPVNRYIVAVDYKQLSMENIATEVSKTLGNGDVEYISPDEVLMWGEVPARIVDLLTSDLRMESSTREAIPIDWVARDGVVDALNRVVDEYKAFRNLSPLRIAVIGPPFSGKSTLARQLSENYQIPLISVSGVVKEVPTILEKKRARNVERSSSLTELQNLVAAAGDEDLPDTVVCRFVKEKLGSVECRNQGYILDGYPPSYASAKDLFGRNHNAADGASDSSNLPEFVFVLEAPLEFLKERILISSSKIPETQIAQRFAEYQLLNTDEDSVLVYFAEMEIAMHSLDINQDKSSTMEKCLITMEQKIGPPRHLLLTTPEEKRRELQKQLRAAAEQHVREAAKMDQPTAFHKKVAQAAYQQRYARWEAELADVASSMDKPVEKKLYMRKYLMTYVLPVLVDGINACQEKRPADPVDYLAEYLLEHSRPLYADDRLVPFVRMTRNAAKKKTRMKAEERKMAPPPSPGLTFVTTLEDDENVYRRLYNVPARESSP